MKKQYWQVMIIYVVMQASSILGVPLFIKLGVGKNADSQMDLFATASGYWAVFSFTTAFFIILYILRAEMMEKNVRVERAPWNIAIMWSILGVFLAMFAQGIAANIELQLFDIKPGSENTQQIVRLVKLTPLLVIVTSIIGPILEEIIFRKIIFGTLYQKYNFWVAAIISSVIFALVHTEPEHILLYSAVGLTFAFLYIKTKRILVPIFAHIAMNTFVIIVQTIYADDIEKLMKQTEQLQAIIGGYWL